ncbi:MAG: hypothetical protein KDE55_25160 [Novosphingobium sp.]|nr:hypothetical protein [Novosphingobium sp.]
MRHDPNTMLGDARDEAADMLRGGMAHPSTKPVLLWGGAGALAGALLPVVSIPVGFVAGAAWGLYKRIRP